MDVKAVISAAASSVNTLLELWPIKIFFTIVATVLTSNHAIALYVFSSMVIIDLFTKVIALSHQCRVDHGESSDFFQSITGIPAARRNRYIQSSIMKHRFGGKIALYMFLTVSAVLVDFFSLKAGYGQAMVPLVWGYLALTEYCSILENLQDAEAEGLSKLISLLKNNRFFGGFFKATNAKLNENED